MKLFIDLLFSLDGTLVIFKYICTANSLFYNDGSDLIDCFPRPFVYAELHHLGCKTVCCPMTVFFTEPMLSFNDDGLKSILLRSIARIWMVTSLQKITLLTDVRFPCLSDILLSFGRIPDIICDCPYPGTIFSRCSLNFLVWANVNDCSTCFVLSLVTALTQINLGSLEVNKLPTLLLLMPSFRRSKDYSTFLSYHQSYCPKLVLVCIDY